MGLVAAILITLAVLGSVLWVMPSRREKSLTAMRSHAMSLGMKVRLLDEKLAKNLFYWLENYRPYTLYECMVPKEAKPNSHKARVVRLKFEEGTHELDSRDELRSELESHGVFQGIPDTCEALIISQGGLAILWRETQQEDGSLKEVESIKECLQRCIEHSKLWTDGQ